MKLLQPLVPSAEPVGHVLERCEPLRLLQRRLADAQARMGVIRPSIPPSLLRSIRPGPAEDDGWTLLVDNPAAAAKLRQLVPRLETLLQERGWQPTQIKIRVQTSNKG